MAKIGPVMGTEEGYKHTWPYNLVYAIFSPDDSNGRWDICFRVYIPGLLESVNELTEREQKIIDMRFHMGLTLEQTGKEFGVSRDRIRQIEEKAIRKLRHPRFYKEWKMVQQKEVWEAKGEASGLLLENAAMRHKLIEIARILGKDYIPEMPDPEPEQKPKTDLDMTIDELELSVRSYNCCARAGYNKVGDFVGKTAEDLARIRNLGRKSIEEVIAKLREHGVVIEYV